MSNKKLGAVLLVVAVLVVGGFTVFKLTAKDDEPTANQTTTQQPENETENEAEDETSTPTNNTDVALTADEVKKHNSEEDCWAIISGQVYDITDYVSNHPGGDEILRACGIDATSFFTERKSPEGEEVGSGTPHSSNAENQLEQYLLGPLAS